MIRTLHAGLALAFALPLLLVSLTGALLGFARESDRMFNVDLVSAPFSSAPTQSAESLQAAAQQHFPDRHIISVQPAKTPFDTTVFLMRDAENQQHEVFIHAQTAEIRGSRRVEDSLYAQLYRLHTTLLLGEYGAWISRFAALGLLLTSLSGLLLRRKSYEQSMSARLHPLLGMTSAPVLAVIAASALLITVWQSATPGQAALIHHLHTGELLGMPGRILWVLASLAMPFLIFGGFKSRRARKLQHV